MTKSATSLLALTAVLALAAPAGAHVHHHHLSSVDNGVHTAAAMSDKIGATAGPSGPPPVPDSPTADKSTPTPPTLPDITSYVLLDAATGAVLAEAAPHLQVPPASLTKLMTAHLVYQALHGGALKLDQDVPVSVDAWHQQGSTMFIDPTSTVTVDQLLHGLLIVSGNDAAEALAEQVAGSPDAFVQQMNKQAATLGLNDTNYTNPTGLPDPALHTSAYDVAELSRAILQNEPEILAITKEPNYTYNSITQGTWNPVLAKDSTVDGLKTGLTKEAGHCIDATAARGSMRFIAVVTGGPTWGTSTAAVENLLDYGQKFFTDVTVATAGQVVATLPSDALDSGSVDITAGQNVTLTLPQDEASAVTHSLSLTTNLTPGVTQGETLGTITYSAGGKILASVPAVAAADSPAATLSTKLKLFLKKAL